MAKEEKIAPKLRFNGYTDDWEQVKLGDVAEKVIQKNNNNAFKNVLTNSAEHGIISQRDFFERNIANKNNISTYYIVQNDDFVYNPRISNSAPYGPINRNKTGYTGIISPLYYVFRVLGINTAFIEWYFKTTCWHKFMYQHGDSGARSDRFSIKDNKLKKLPIKLPADDTEQEKIAKTLNSLNNTIQLHERKCEELALIKKALLQKLFPKKDEFKPEVRYKNFSDAWEQRKLGEIFNQTRVVTNPEINNIELWSLTIKDGLTRKTDRFNRQFLVKKDDNFKKVFPGDIVYNPMNMTLGAVGYNSMRIPVAVSGYYVTMQLNKYYDSHYFVVWLRSPIALSLYKKYATGSLTEKQRIQFLTLSEIPAVLPTYEEQKKIGKFFKQLDSLIALYQRKLEKLKQLKKFLLQNMFI